MESLELLIYILHALQAILAPIEIGLAWHGTQAIALFPMVVADSACLAIVEYNRHLYEKHFTDLGAMKLLLFDVSPRVAEHETGS